MKKRTNALFSKTSLQPQRSLKMSILIVY